MAKPARVLVVDDEPSIVVTLKAVLEDAGFRVWTATAMAQVPALLDQETFNAAIVDLVLGQDNGIDVLRLLRDRQPACISIVLTGHASLASAIEALRLGAFDYVTKPCNPEELILVVKGAVARSAIAQALQDRADRQKTAAGGRTSRRGDRLASPEKPDR